MNPEAQRIAIAEACGWKLILSGEDFCTGLTPRGHPATTIGGRYTIPDYLTDLNAMHEAEKVLTGSQRRAFADQLARVVFFDGDRQRNLNTENDEWWNDLNEDFLLANATAAQRAESFLRTLNLWKAAA